MNRFLLTFLLRGSTRARESGLTGDTGEWALQIVTADGRSMRRIARYAWNADSPDWRPTS
jgi:hypothetical protein